MIEFVIALAVLRADPLTLPAPEAVPDSSQRLLDAVCNSPQPLADRLDALYFAMLGRPASGREQRLAKHTLGANPAAEHLKNFVRNPPRLLGTQVFQPGFGDDWFPAAGRPSPPPGLPSYATPLYEHGPLGRTLSGWFVPVRPPDGPPVDSTPVRSLGPHVVPNPLAFPWHPWFQPGSTESIPRVGTSSQKQ